MENWVNIPRSVTDPFHRYRMPIPQLKIKKGPKTVIVNMVAIALAIERSPSVILKFMSLKFQVVSFDNGNDYYALNGNYDVETILNCLDKFIDEYVLCHGCQSPSTYFELENETIILNCWNCDNKFSLSDKDSKLYSCILVNLPSKENEKIVTMMLSHHNGRIQTKMLSSQSGRK